MNEIVKKDRCCGCSACYSVCVVGCINMVLDSEGFMHPEISEDLCIDCGLCRKVCPVLNVMESGNVVGTVYAAVSSSGEAVRAHSSSGGVFTELSRVVLAHGGVVFGVRFDCTMKAVHDFTEDEAGLDAFRGSKYVQSRVGESFGQVRSFLEGGRRVLFSGTPCQISGLKRYLRREYDNLLTVEVVCHGVPSPVVFGRYIDSISGSVDDVCFRDKATGWKNYSVRFGNYRQCYKDNYFMRVFLDDLSLRPSCYSCPSKSGISGADITLGDFWGIERLNSVIDDDRGISLVVVRTSRGADVLHESQISLLAEYPASVLKYNPSFSQSAKRPVHRDIFMKECVAKGFMKAYDMIYPPSLITQIRRRLKLLLK